MKIEKINSLCDKVIKAGFLFLFLLTPLILTPWTFELFEFNKMIFVFIMTTIIIATWIAKMICAKKVIFVRTFWDLPLLAFVIAQLAGTIFSLHPHTSFWGYYTRMHGGFGSTLAYALLYWALVSTTDRQRAKQYLRIIILSGLLVAGYGILEKFGIDKNYWQQDVQNRVFSTLGQPNWLAAWLGMIVFLPLALTAGKSKKSVFYYLVFASYLLAFIFTQSKSGLIGLTLTWPLFWFFGFAKTKPNRKIFFITTLALAISLLVFKNPARDFAAEKLNFKPAENLPPGIHISGSGNIRQVVWKGAIEVWKKAPLAGTGTETFGYSYYQSRLAEHNLLSEWDFLYNKAHNEYLNFLANNGIIGLITYLGLVASYLFWLAKNRQAKHQQKKILVGLGAGFVSLLITNFFGFSVVATGLLFFLFPALSQALTTEKIPFSKIRVKKIFGPGLIGLISLFIIFRFGQIWWADTRLAASEKNIQDELGYLALENLKSAVRLRPNEPFFHDRYAVAAATVALQAYQQEQTALADQLSKISISQSDLAISLNPYHLNHWKNRARIFINLTPIEPNYLLKAGEALQTATALAPTDAKLYYNLALIYSKLEQDRLAIETLQKAVSLKPNYKDARFALAYFLKEQKESAEAVTQLQYIIDFIDPTDSTIIKLIEEWQP